MTGSAMRRATRCSRRWRCRLATSLGPDDVLARLIGDEFAVLLANERDPLDIAARAETLIELIGRPFSICGHQFASVGQHRHRARTVPCAQRRRAGASAPTSRCSAPRPRAGGVTGLFDTGMENQLAATRAFQDELRYAFTGRQFELHFQPQISLATGRLIGAEALLRWRHPTRGLLYPMAFLSVLETHALAFEAGCWVLDEACRTLADWRTRRARADPHGGQSFAAQLRTGTLVEEIEGTLARHRPGARRPRAGNHRDHRAAP